MIAEKGSRRPSLTKKVEFEILLFVRDEGLRWVLSGGRCSRNERWSSPPAGAHARFETTSRSHLSQLLRGNGAKQTHLSAAATPSAGVS